MRNLTDKQQRYAEYRLSGYPPLVSTRLAGYADNGGSQIRVRAHHLERHEGIQAAIQAMKDAICWEALKRVRKGRPVSQFALEMLTEWPGTSPLIRKRMRLRLAKAMLKEADGRDSRRKKMPRRKIEQPGQSGAGPQGATRPRRGIAGWWRHGRTLPPLRLRVGADITPDAARVAWRLRA